MAEAGAVGRRRRLQQRLEAVVRANRFTIAVVFPVVGAALFVASAEGWLPGWLAFNPALVLVGVAVMRLPLVAGLLPLVGRRAAPALAALAGYAYAIEAVGLATGWPYGEFEYGVALGPMVEGVALGPMAGGVPLGLPVFFVPLVVNGYLLALLLAGRSGRRPAVRAGGALAVVLVVDLVLDPAAVSLGLWRYAEPGAYYGVPASNYLGWTLSGLVGMALLEVGFGRAALVERLRACEFLLDDLVSFVVLWGAVNAYFGNWLPVALAAGLTLGLARTGRFDLDVAPRTLPGR